MPDLLIPDVSEFQTVDFDVFSGPIIVRAHNSNRADLHWPQHAAGAAKQPWWAAYQYLTKTADPAAAAHAFLATLGDWRPNCTILDLEEGDGDQTARQHAWLQVMASDPARDWTYSGDYFARTHGLTVDWIAAYQSREPTAAHKLWQFTDAQSFPGIGVCDGSTFFGTVADLIALTGGGPAPQEEEVAQGNAWSTDGKWYVEVIRGLDDNIWIKRWNAATQKWDPDWAGIPGGSGHPGGPHAFSGAPSVAAGPGGRFDICARGNDGALWRNTLTGDTWSGWFSDHGAFH